MTVNQVKVLASPIFSTSILHLRIVATASFAILARSSDEGFLARYSHQPGTSLDITPFSGDLFKRSISSTKDG